MDRIGAHRRRETRRTEHTIHVKIKKANMKLVGIMYISWNVDSLVDVQLQAR